MPHQLRLADARLARDHDRPGRPFQRTEKFGAQREQLRVARGELVVVGHQVRNELRDRRSDNFWRRGANSCHRSDESIAAAVIRGDEARLLRIVADRAPDLRDRFLQHAVRGEDVGPHFLQQLFLREHTVIVLDEIAQHAHGARLERHDDVAAIQQLDAVREMKSAELQNRSVRVSHDAFWNRLESILMVRRGSLRKRYAAPTSRLTSGPPPLQVRYRSNTRSTSMLVTPSFEPASHAGRGWRALMSPRLKTLAAKSSR